ncbi:TPA: hypothetical protein N0F65_007784 [Lagenidium giganteum]|uniref:Uncharacterized protein n=1 Tax=Lagenidium giganteum TaxID=4803 RepID=A0AAV2Z286_9STRA|nr:TPA: hypothetical protein N0F65_007784 [Lagenidium giganteum]
MDRRGLLRRRQRIREEKQTKMLKENLSSVEVEKRAPGRKSSELAGKKSLEVSLDGQLLVRQILQRHAYGEADTFMKHTSKHEMYQLLLDVSNFANEIRKQQLTTNDAVDSDRLITNSKINQLSNELLHTEHLLREVTEEKKELIQRLKLGNDEYSSVVSYLRDVEERAVKQEKQSAADRELAESLSVKLEQRDQQLRATTDELQAMLIARKELDIQEATAIHAKELTTALQQEQQQHKEMRREFRQTKLSLEQAYTDLAEAKEQMLTIHGQLQQAQEEEQKRKAQEFRAMDLEIRQLKQALNRIRIDLESEKSQREKAEENSLQLMELVDVREVLPDSMEATRR